MNLESLRAFCKSLPHVTEDVKWGHDLCFLIGGKMFAVAPLEKTAEGQLTFKCTAEKFAELLEVDGVIPAPYMARNNWVMMERYDALRDSEIRELVRESYEMVKAKLPKKMQAKLSSRHAKSERKGRKGTRGKSKARLKGHS
jgi:predicted DNA-binding protein (MmcQ/YjbR family)